jgi:hypothetical protein
VRRTVDGQLGMRIDLTSSLEGNIDEFGTNGIIEDGATPGTIFLYKTLRHWREACKGMSLR